MRRHTSHRPGHRSLLFQGLLTLCLALVLLLIGQRPQAAAVSLTTTTVKLTVDVSGLSGTITGVSVTLTNLSTAWVDDLDILLIHPNGSNNLVFWSDSTSGAVDNLSNATFTIADSASTCLPNASATSIPAGSYKPTTYGTPEAITAFNNLSTDHPSLTLTFAGSGCAGTSGSASFASAFGGLSPNGTWEMWVELDTGGGTGTLEKWSLTITTSTGSSTEARVEAFTATPSVRGGTQLAWRTGFEVDNLGFNVYRADHGQRTKLNPSVIAGSALLAGPGTALTAGRNYVWWDTSEAATADAQYWLEDIDLSGQRTWHGPVAIDWSAQPGPPPLSGRGQAALLSNLGRAATDRQPLSVPVTRRATLASQSAVLSARQPHLAARTAVKLAVRQEGWYRVTQAELVAAGLDPGVDPRLLHLYVDGREVPILMSGQADGRFDQGDTLEFYGLGLNAAWTDTRVYWLVVQGEPGRRIRPALTFGTQSADRSFPYTIERHDRSVYFSALLNGERENFFGPVVSPEPTVESLQVTHLAPEPSGTPLLEVALQGVTQGPHRVQVTLNGVSVGEITFQDQKTRTESFSLSTSGLHEGENQLELMALGGERDISLIDTIRLTYWRTYTADGDTLRFSATGRQRLTIAGFSSAPLRVLDITEVDAVREVPGMVKEQDGGFAVSLNVPGSGQRTLLALAAAQAKSVAGITLNQPSHWRQNGHGADLIIISHGDFSAGLGPLLAQRQGQELSVALVDVEDLYDEFSTGHKTPYAVRDFLGYAATQWALAPRFVLLVGDASWDPKNYLDYGNYDFVPTKLIDTQLMETASDDWFVDIDQDGLADMAVGRLPGRTVEEIDHLVTKIVGYNQTGAGGGVLLVTDLNDGIDFGAIHDALRESIPPTVPVEEIDRGHMDSETAKSELMARLNRGPAVVNYTGHGSVDLWRGSLLTADDAAELNNGDRLSVFVTMTCLNGYFQDAALDSLAEALLHATEGGAVAVWAPSGMTGPIAQAVMNQELFRWLFEESSSTGEPFRLGEVVRRAKAAVSDRDVQRTWILLGDPTMLVKLP
jgi:subtilisin-like proprotein convertase family protein